MWMHTCSWPSCLVETKKDLARQREEGRAKKSMCKVLRLEEAVRGAVWLEGSE